MGHASRGWKKLDFILAGLKSSHASVGGWRVKNKWTRGDGQQTPSVRELAGCTVLNCLICWRQCWSKQCQVCADTIQCLSTRLPCFWAPIVCGDGGDLIQECSQLTGAYMHTLDWLHATLSFQGDAFRTRMSCPVQNYCYYYLITCL